MFRDSFFLKGFSIFILLNIFLYLFIIQFHEYIPLNYLNYKVNAHHYIPDNRTLNKPFSLINSLAQYDSQWYLKIAEIGYPKHATFQSMNQKEYMESLSYAFFPLYPLILNLLNRVFVNIELTAFIFAQAILAVNYISLYFVVSKIYNKTVALKTAFLLFFFPFSIFYRSYFTEGILLFFLIWFSYFWVTKKYLYSAIFLGLINITKANIFVLNFVYVFFLARKLLRKQLTLRTFLYSLVYISLPSLIWILFNYINTNNPIFFLVVRENWNISQTSFFPIYNLFLLSITPFLSIHDFHTSQIDNIFFLIILILLFRSRGVLKDKLWWISFCIGISPFLVTDFMSYTRYQIISFPLFIYVALKLKSTSFYLLLSLFILGLLYTSLYFVSWNWLG